MDWCKGKFTGKPHILWENLWFPVDFPLNQSIEINSDSIDLANQGSPPGMDKFGLVSSSDPHPEALT